MLRQLSFLKYIVKNSWDVIKTGWIVSKHEYFEEYDTDTP